MSKFGSYEDKPFLAELYDLVPGYSGRRDLQFYLDLPRKRGVRAVIAMTFYRLDDTSELDRHRTCVH